MAPPDIFAVFPYCHMPYGLSPKPYTRICLQASMEVDARQEEIDNSAAALPVSHLLLCLHGIGQNMTGANIAGVAAIATTITALLPQSY